MIESESIRKLYSLPLYNENKYPDTSHQIKNYQKV